jgi:hypothetical protein
VENCIAGSSRIKPCGRVDSGELQSNQDREAEGSKGSAAHLTDASRQAALDSRLKRTSPATLVTSGRSFAEVVRKGSRRPSSALSAAPESELDRRRLKVRFTTTPSVVFFLGDRPLCEVGRFASVNGPPPSRCWPSPVPVLKPNPAASGERFRTRISRHSHREVTRKLLAREATVEQQWQLVRKRFWWRRKERQNLSARSRATTTSGSHFSKQRAVGRCFNCLARDHRVAGCRDPTRCWKCKAFGHISSSCRNKPPLHSGLTSTFNHNPPSHR